MYLYIDLCQKRKLGTVNNIQTLYNFNILNILFWGIFFTIVVIHTSYWLSYSMLLSFTFRPDLMVKKLRYYARFIVVCLLLKKMKLVRDLVRELSKHIDEYTATYEPEDQLEWSLVLGEIKAFIEADTIVNVLDSDSNSIVLSHR